MVEFGGAEFLPDFAELMKNRISQRHPFTRTDYYQKLLATYPDDSYVTMAFLNLQNELPNWKLKRINA